MIVLVVIVAVGAAAAYLATADKTYEAEADLLVTPVTGDVLLGLPVIRSSNDPTRDVETAARLVTTRDVAARVIKELKLADSPSGLLERVEAAPVAQSNIVAITAEAGTPEEARDVANGFGRGVVADRTETLHQELDKAIEQLEERIASGQGTTTTEGVPLEAQLAELQTLRAQNDPTLRLETAADAPSSPSSPRPFLTIAAAILAGLVLGVGGAVALQALDPRLRREEQLRELYRLPILARIPKEKDAATAVRTKGLLGRFRRHRKALSPSELSPATLESYRTLRTMLAASRASGREGRSILITGPSPSEGKTTTAINLAFSLARSGQRVIVIEADFRRPTIAEALNLRAKVGIGRVLLGSVPLDDALVTAHPFGEQLRVLPAGRGDDLLVELLSLPAADALLEQAEQLADYVVIDSPPLTEVIDALSLAQQVDDVVIVVRIGNSRLAQLARLSDLLAQNNIRPSGFALVGVGSSDETGYYLSGARTQMPTEHPQEQPRLDSEPDPERASDPV